MMANCQSHPPFENYFKNNLRKVYLMHSYKKLSLGFPFSPGFSNFQVPGLLDFSVPGLPRKKGRTEIKEKEKKIVLPRLLDFFIQGTLLVPGLVPSRAETFLDILLQESPIFEYVLVL